MAHLAMSANDSDGFFWSVAGRHPLRISISENCLRIRASVDQEALL